MLRRHYLLYANINWGGNINYQEYFLANGGLLYISVVEQNENITNHQ